MPHATGIDARVQPAIKTAANLEGSTKADPNNDDAPK